MRSRFARFTSLIIAVGVVARRVAGYTRSRRARSFASPRAIRPARRFPAPS